jgi:hypothetical protein
MAKKTVNFKKLFKILGIDDKQQEAFKKIIERYQATSDQRVQEKLLKEMNEFVNENAGLTKDDIIAKNLKACGLDV